MTSPQSPLHDRMIFLVGARRSGTNWLQRVLGAHPDVAVVPSETHLFSSGIKQLRERFHHSALSSPGTFFVYMDPIEMVRSLRELCDRIFRPFLETTPGATRLVERTPEHVGCLDVIGEIYPDAWVVHIIRDGRDVARSLVAQPWGTAPETIAHAAEEWRLSVDAGEAAGSRLARYRTVRYEELLADPRRQVTDLYEWLGLSATSDVVEQALAEAEVRFNEDPGAPAAQAGKWRSAFTPSDLADFMRVAGDTLIRTGYAAEDVTAGRSPAVTRRGDGLQPGSGGILGRRRLRRRDRPGERQRQLVALLTETQRAFDQIVTAVLTRRLDRLRELSLPSAQLRVAGVGDGWNGRGDAAWERLASTLASDRVLDGRQIAGDLHPGFPTSTAVMTYAAPDGALHVRTVAVSMQNGRVARLTYYRFPIG